MEVPVQPKPWEPPSAELVGLQFGLSTAKDLLTFSVLEGSKKSQNTLKDLVDPRLGLPSEDDRCATCGGANYEECTGHFGHVKLTQPIYHPNHMRLLQRVLQKICLGCGTPKAKKKKRLENSSEEAVNRRKRSRGLDTENEAERGQRDVLDAHPIEVRAGGGVIVLSSDDEDGSIPHDILRVVQPNPHRPPSLRLDASTSETASPGVRDIRGGKGKVHSNGSLYADLTSNGTAKSKSGSKQGRKKIFKATPVGVDVLHADTLETAVPSRCANCKHCSGGNPEYPPISLKIQAVKGKKKDEVWQILQMELPDDPEKRLKFDIANDFWAFVDGPGRRQDEEYEVPLRRVLLPAEALKILRKIPEASISKLGMNRLVARPEALIMECVPVPPNCTRTTDYKYVNNTTAVRFGTAVEITHSRWYLRVTFLHLLLYETPQKRERMALAPKSQGATYILSEIQGWTNSAFQALLTHLPYRMTWRDESEVGSRNCKNRMTSDTNLAGSTTATSVLPDYLRILQDQCNHSVLADIFQGYLSPGRNPWVDLFLLLICHNNCLMAGWAVVGGFEDRVTRTLQNLVNEITRISSTRSGKAMLRARRDETKVLQGLTAEYLQEKGAPKAVPGKEPLKKDRNGRVTKQDDHRWTKEWLTQHILGKGGNYTARAVIVGDPSLGVEEIGVPRQISQKLTIPVRAARWNLKRLQEYVDRTQTMEGSGGPGAMRIVRDGEAFQVLTYRKLEVQIGDIVHRHLQDGDYIYANRPPSVHKHSLMALKVKVHDGLVLTVNPLICPPFNADFDGDIFHIFVPQSLQALAELEQLMSVQHQIVSDQGGHPLLGLTQDTLLAAHLITSSKMLLDKDTMDQLSMWSARELPDAAIVKSPRGGPFWTGEQLFGLTLPTEFNMGSADEGVLIQGGDILKWPGDAKLLHRDKDSITGALCVQLGPKSVVDYFNSAKGLLHAWLQMQGFSTGLTDFLVTDNLISRGKMLQSVFDEYLLKSIQESCDSIQILDAKAHALGMSEMEVQDRFGRLVINPETLTNKVRVVEQAAQVIFRARAADAENIVLRYAEKGNSLLLMVKSGSKGSVGKLLQQIAGMGLQLYRGKHLLPFSGIRHHAMSDSPLLDWWEDHGLVRSSLVDGLSAPELFNHVVADRTGILRKHVEVIQPGTLFKSLMLFLRDLHVMYDGSVRSQTGHSLVQFCYGGALGAQKKVSADKESSWNEFPIAEDMERNPSASRGKTIEKVTWDEDDSKRWQLSALAGEPVGVLAATAIAQPAYELMLDAPNLNGPFKPRPLELVQETLYPREKTDLKPTDRCVIIRLVKCGCPYKLCLERRILDVQGHLKRITLKMVAESSAIEFWNMDDLEAAGSNGAVLRLGSPWLGHIALSRDKMQQHQVDAEDVVYRLREKYSVPPNKKKKKGSLGRIFFCHSDYCSTAKGLCLHFSPELPKEMQNQNDDEIYNKALLFLLHKIQGSMIPAFLDYTVKGYERMESVKVVTESPTWSTWHSGAACDNDLREELVLEVVIASTVSKTKRGMAWSSVKEACLPIMEMVDWKRSMPYSIQEIRHALGVEVAYQMVVRRLGLVLEKTAPHIHPVHVKLIADMMTFSGDANGFTFSGYRDMIKSAGISAPFTEASFQKPIRNILDAAGKGATDSLEGVMTSCVWGKEAPLGTGINFDILWQPPRDPAGDIAARSEEARDVHLMWKQLDEKCIPDAVVPPSPTHSLPDLLHNLQEEETDFQAAFSPRHTPDGDAGDDDNWGNEADEDEGGWGGKSSKSGVKTSDDEGGWGSSVKESTDGGGWDIVAEVSDKGGWGSSVKEITDEGGWGSGAVVSDKGGWGSSVKENIDEGGWGSIAAVSDKGGWGSSVKENTNEGGWGSAAAVSDKGVWDSLDSGARNTGTTNEGSWKQRDGGDTPSNLAGNTSAWDANLVKEVVASGWDSVQTQDNQGGGWDSLASGGGNKDKRNDPKGGWAQQDRELIQGGGWDTNSGMGNAGNKNEAKGSWEQPDRNDTQGGGWDSLDTGTHNAGKTNEPKGNWEQRNSVDTPVIVSGNTSAWDVNPVQESEPNGWDSVQTQDIQGGWDSLTSGGGKRGPRSEPKESWEQRDRVGTLSSFAGNNSAWDVNPVQEIGKGGWDSVQTQSSQGGGWDSFAEPQSDRAPTDSQDSGWRKDFVLQSDDDRGNGRSWTRGRGRGRGRGSYDRDRGRVPGSGANALPLGRQRQFGNASQRTQDTGGSDPGANEAHISNERDPRGSSQSLREDGGAGPSSGWGDLTSTSITDSGDWNQSAKENSLAQLPTSDQDKTTDTGGDWGELVSGTSIGDGWLADGWASVNDDTPADGWATALDTSSQHHEFGIRTFARPYSTVGAIPRVPRQEVVPECKDIDDIVKSMRRILFNISYDVGARLSEEDDAAVQAVLAYHPNYTEKLGCGIAHIKVDTSPGFLDNRCFWIVRTDGSETDFSYHKCLKEKAAKEYPTFRDRYHVFYGGNRRPHDPPAIFVEDLAEDKETQAEETQVEAGMAEEAGIREEVGIVEDEILRVE